MNNANAPQQIRTGVSGSDAMTMASAFAVGAAVADGPFPIGDAIGLTALGVTATVVHSPEIVAKMTREIDRIATKMGGPQGVQYSLRATRAGAYPCYTCSGGTIVLNVGDVWKYGETINPAGRYSETLLRNMGLERIDEFYGNQVQIKIAEKGKIYGYFFLNAHLPPGNKIFR